MLVSGKMIKEMGKGHCLTSMVINIKGNGQMIKESNMGQLIM